MKLGVCNNGWWIPAARQAGCEVVELPVAGHPSGNAYAADAAARLANGRTIVDTVHDSGVDLLLDNGGAGLGFVREVGADNLRLAHEMAGKPLCSHFIDPMTTALQGLDWGTVWPCLQSAAWIKAVWDRAQVTELQRFGVPNVVHLPMAAPQREYAVAPVDPRQCRYAVSFVGGQNTGYFGSQVSVPSESLWPGTLAQAVHADLPNQYFHDIYYDLYALSSPIVPEDDSPARVRKTADYFRAKLFYQAATCIRNRDRYVIFLRRKLGDMFHLVGTRWDSVYGLRASAPFPTTEAYLNHFRETAINLNLVNGNAETGLNMRHFEITAAGGFMLCHEQPELAECFEVGKECAAFRGEDDLLDKIHYYLAHPEERTVVALAGQRRTLSQHLYVHRVKTLLSMFQPKLPPATFSTRRCHEDFAALLPDPDVILDCGANIGQMARGLRQLYPNAKIYSFEPVASVFEKLREACAEWKIRPVRKAVGDCDGRAWIHLTASPEANSLLGFQPDNPCARWTQVVGREEVEVCTLDRWCAENDIHPNRVGLLKLDVQGAELQALYGARELLKYVKLIYVEVSFVPMYKDSPLHGDIDRFLTESGYKPFALYPSDQPHNWGDALYVRERK